MIQACDLRGRVDTADLRGWFSGEQAVWHPLRRGRLWEQHYPLDEH